MTTTATNGGTNLLAVTNPQELYAKLDEALSTVAAKAASGTAASILSNNGGSGANILQAVFYPKKIFDSSTSVNWIGEMQNLWYFVDPYIQNSTIHEDTDLDLKLDMINDYIIRFTFDNSLDKTMVQRYNDADGDGVVADADKVGGLIDPDYVKSIWRAGMRLWARPDSGTTKRTIYTGYNSTSGNAPQKFSNEPADGYFNTWPNVWNALQIPNNTQIAGITDAQREALATKLISYIRGTDPSFGDGFPYCLNADCAYRSRKVTINVCSGNYQKRCTASTVAADCPVRKQLRQHQQRVETRRHSSPQPPVFSQPYNSTPIICPLPAATVISPTRASLIQAATKTVEWCTPERTTACCMLSIWGFFR